MPSKGSLWVLAAPPQIPSEAAPQEGGEESFSSEEQAKINEAIQSAEQAGLTGEAVDTARAILPLMITQRLAPRPGQKQLSFEEALKRAHDFLLETAKEAASLQTGKVRGELDELNGFVTEGQAHQIKAMLGLDIQLEKMKESAGSFGTLMKGGQGRGGALKDLRVWLKQNNLENVDPEHRAKAMQYYDEKTPFVHRLWEKKNGQYKFVANVLMGVWHRQNTPIQDIVDTLTALIKVESAQGGELENAISTAKTLSDGLEKISGLLKDMGKYVALMPPSEQPTEATPYSMPEISERGKFRKEIALQPPKATIMKKTAAGTATLEAPAETVSETTVDQDLLNEAQAFAALVPGYDEALMQSIDSLIALVDQEEQILQKAGMSQETTGGVAA